MSSEALSVVHTPVEEKGNSEKEVSSQLSHWKTSLKTSELDKTEDQGTPSTDVPEQFSDINSRYNFISLCAVKEKACKVIFPDYVKSDFKTLSIV